MPEELCEPEVSSGLSAGSQVKVELSSERSQRLSDASERHQGRRHIRRSPTTVSFPRENLSRVLDTSASACWAWAPPRGVIACVALAPHL